MSIASEFIKLAQTMDSTPSHHIRHHSFATKFCSLAMKVFFLLFIVYATSLPLVPTNPQSWVAGYCEPPLVIFGKAPCSLTLGFSLLQQRRFGSPKSQLLEQWMVPSWSSDYFWFLVTNKDPLFHWHRNLIHVALHIMFKMAFWKKQKGKWSWEVEEKSKLKQSNERNGQVAQIKLTTEGVTTTNKRKREMKSKVMRWV